MLTAVALLALAADPVAVDIGPATFKVPAEWKKETPRRMFRKFQFQAPTKGGDRAPVFYISELTGGGGGVDQNINRWKGQYSKVVGEPKVEKFTVDGIEATLLDITGTYTDSMAGPFAGGASKTFNENRTLAAVVLVPGSDNSFFFRIDGPKAAVAAQRDAFVKVLKSGKKK